MSLRLPPTEAQAAVWFAQQLAPGDCSFNTGEYLEIHGPVDPVVLRAAVTEVIDEIEVLRATFEADPDGLFQIVADSAAELDWELPLVDLGGEQHPEDAAKRWMADDLALDFDLTEQPPFSFALLTIAPDHHIWYQAVHHVALDGFGHSILAARIAGAYSARLTGRPRSAPPLTSLSEVLADEREYTGSARFAEDRAYWLDQISGLPEPRPTHPATRQDSVRADTTITPTELDAIRRLAKRLNVTWPEVFVAAFARQLHRETGEENVVVNLPVTARTTPLLRRAPVTLSNAVPLCLTVQAETEFGTIVSQASDAVRAAHQHQRYRQERLLREAPHLAAGRRQLGPDLNIMVFGYDLDFAGAPVTAHNLSDGPVEDLTLQLYNRLDGGGVLLELDGNAERYDRAELSDQLGRFRTSLAPIFNGSATTH